MPLAIFDIDGTLCQTSDIDDRCWCDAVRDVYGIDGISTDWSDYPHSTDGAIASAVIREHLGEDPTVERIGVLRDRFVTLLHEAYAADASSFCAMPGAGELLNYLREHGWQTALATGGWTASARFKLDCAGIDHADMAAAFACDAHPREAIISIARERAASKAGVALGVMRDTVYIGDGVWDVRASKKLDIGFVGRATGARAQALRVEGANEVFSDFTEPERVFVAIKKAL